MIARIWKAHLSSSRIDAYERFAREVSLAMFQAQVGFQGCVMTRAGSVCEVMTLWEDSAAVALMEASPTYGRVVEAIRATEVLVAELGVRLVEVHLAAMPELHWPDGSDAPSAIPTRRSR